MSGFFVQNSSIMHHFASKYAEHYKKHKEYKALFIKRLILHKKVPARVNFPHRKGKFRESNQKRALYPRTAAFEPK